MQILVDKRRLMLLLGLLLTTGFLATSLASYFVSTRMIRADIVEQQLPLTGDNIYSEIQGDLVRPVFVSSMMAYDTFVRDWVLAGEPRESDIVRYLKEIAAKYEAKTSFFVSERTRLYYQSEGVLKKVREDEERDRWYFRVRDMSAPYEINVDPDMANQDALTIFINHRVFDYNGNFIGAAGVGLTVDSVRSIIESYQKRYGRTVYFVARDGNVVLTGAAGERGPGSIRDASGLSAVAEAALSSPSGSFEYTRDGDTVFLLTRLIPELNWYVFVEQVEAEAIAGPRRTLMANLAVCLVITVVVLMAVGYVVNVFQRRLERMATTDKLTGLANRQAFELIYTQAIREVERSGQPLSILLFDVDRFKRVNDRHGHPVGDRVLAAVAEAARESLRAVDAVCRWGGEEFLVLLKDCRIDDAHALAEKVRERIATLRVDDVEVTVSLGVAEYRPGDSRNGLVARADRALYAAKERGRNRTEIANDS